MSNKALLHQAKLREWTDRFASQKESGLSIVDWCHQHHFPRSQFFYWKRQMKDETVSPVLPDIVPLSFPSAPAESAADLSSNNCPSFTSFASSSHAIISLNGISIEIDSSAPEAFIRCLIKVVRYAPWILGLT